LRAVPLNGSHQHQADNHHMDSHEQLEAHLSLQVLNVPALLSTRV
jgi:hypothetical protein